MLKLLVCILGIFGISLGLLRLRQERLSSRHEMNRLHDEIERSQGTLWNQQLDIARETSPEAMRERSRDLRLDPKAEASPAGIPPWTERRIFPDKGP